MRYNICMKITKNLTDQAVLEEIGKRLAKQRLALSKTQAELSAECGLARRTIQYAEAGKSVQSDGLIRILRALDLLDVLEALLPDETFSPMDMLKFKNKERRRVGKKRGSQQTREADGWEWGDEG